MYANTEHLFFSFWLTALCITGSRFIRLTGAGSGSLLLMAEYYSWLLVCMYLSMYVPVPEYWYVCTRTSLSIHLSMKCSCFSSDVIDPPLTIFPLTTWMCKDDTVESPCPPSLRACVVLWILFQGWEGRIRVACYPGLIYLVLTSSHLQRGRLSLEGPLGQRQRRRLRRSGTQDPRLRTTESYSDGLAYQEACGCSGSPLFDSRARWAAHELHIKATLSNFIFIRR